MGRRGIVLMGEDLALPSQRLVEAALMGDVEVVEESLAAAIFGASRQVMVDVNYIGTVKLRVKSAEVVIGEDKADEVRIGYEEFRTDVSALFSAAHSGHVEIEFLYALGKTWLDHDKLA